MKNKAEIIFEKLSFIAFTPLTVKNKEELRSINGYLKEKLNEVVSVAAGAGTGGLVGGTLGMLTRKPELIAPSIVAGSAIGGITSGIRGVRKTEREAGVKPTGVGKFLGRTAGRIVTAPVGGVGSYLGDYVVSRHLQEYKNLK
jgi:hypothetical protein